MKGKGRLRHLGRALFSFDNLMISLATIGVILLLRYIPQNVDFLDPIGAAIGDVDLTDMVFSQFRDEEKYGVDTNIVIVNLGLADRYEVAEILDNINRAEPLVVGIDVFFRHPKDAEDDARLAAAMKRTKNLVLVSKVAWKVESLEEDVDRDEMSFVNPEIEFDTLERSDPMFLENASTGFANLNIDQDASYMTCREISFLETWSGNREPSFALRIAEIYDSEAASVAAARGVGEETINFRGNLKSFFHLDVDQALDPEMDLSFIKGKIVLMGFLGADLGTESLEDRYFTPLNERYVGRSVPDCFGVVIHANVIAMMLRGEYIESMSSDAAIWIGLLVLVLNVMMFTYMYHNYDDWYDVFAISTQLIESIIIMFLIVIVFDKMAYKLDLTPALMTVFVVGVVHDLYQDSLKKLAVTAFQRMKHRRNRASSTDTSNAK